MVAKVVSTGQITIVDANDAKPMYSYIDTAGMSTTQLITKVDLGTYKYAPVDWGKLTAAGNLFKPLVLTWTVWVGGQNASDRITNVKWTKTGNIDGSGAYNSGVGGTTNTYGLKPYATTGVANSDWNADASKGAQIDSTTAMKVTVSESLTDIVPSLTFVVTGDYTDVDTGYVTSLTNQIELSGIMAGSSATYLEVNGNGNLVHSNTSNQSVAVLWADLINSDNGVDDTKVSYAWYKYPYGVNDLIVPGSNHGFIATGKLSGLRTNDDMSSITSTALNKVWTSDPNVTTLPRLPINTDFTENLKAIVVGADAVNSMASYKVIARDNNTGITYEKYFIVKDQTDQYSVTINSSAGTTFKNGVGESVLTPKVWNGTKAVTPLTGWDFQWSIADRNGSPSLLSSQETGGFKTYTVSSFVSSIKLKFTTIDGALANQYYKLTTADNTSYILKSYSIDTVNKTITFVGDGFPVPSGVTGTLAVTFTGAAFTASLVGATLSRCADTFYVTKPTITVRDEDIVSKGIVSVNAVRP